MELQEKAETSRFFPKRPDSGVTSLTPVEKPKLSLVAPDAPVAPLSPVTQTLPAVIEASGATGRITKDENFQNSPSTGQIFLSQSGHAFAETADARNRLVLAVGSRQLNLLIGEDRRKQGLKARPNDLKEVNDALQAYAEQAGIVHDVWYRVAPIPGGIEIDLGDVSHTRIRITAGKVEVVSAGSETRFYRTAMSAPMKMPAEIGDLKLLYKYVNLHPMSRTVFIAWLAYTLAHPKLASSKYVILVLNGHQGSGKSVLCRLILWLLDPNMAGIQMLPRNGKDLAIASQNAHVLCYDNMRDVKADMADHLCVAATGGTLSCRQLFTDADQHVTHLHVALVLNGIHSFVNQPDLDQRCLKLELLAIPEGNRKSEAQLLADFQADLPAIQRGLFDLIAEVFKYLPSATVTYPERMYDFSKWLAAIEMVDGVQAGVYQEAYSYLLNEGQRDTLLDNLLAAAILDFAETQFDDDAWSGTPSDLLTELSKFVSQSSQRSRDWPDNPIALSKRLVPLRAALMTQGVIVELKRGKHRTITINKQGKK